MNENTLKTDSPGRDELVAYLDGELSDEQTREIKDALAKDPQLREELATLQKTWDILDRLPTSRLTESFTKSTVEMVALRTQASPANRILSIGKWLLASLLLISIPLSAYYFGFQKQHEQLSQENNSIKKDLPIIENLSLYRSVNADLDAAEGIEFLELLSNESDLFIVSGEAGDE